MGYAIKDVPPSGTDRSRFADLGTTPAGIGGNAAEVVVNVYTQLAEELVASAAPLAPDPIEVELRRVERRADGTYRLVKTGSVRGVPTLNAIRSDGKFKRRVTRGGAFLDLFFARDAEAQNVRDADVFRAALELAGDEHFAGDPLRKLNELVGRVVCCRHGLAVKPWELPL
jgi:hypothetical protein